MQRGGRMVKLNSLRQKKKHLQKLKSKDKSKIIKHKETERKQGGGMQDVNRRIWARDIYAERGAGGWNWSPAEILGQTAVRIHKECGKQVNNLNTQRQMYPKPKHTRILTHSIASLLTSKPKKGKLPLEFRCNSSLCSTAQFHMTSSSFSHHALVSD